MGLVTERALLPTEFLHECFEFKRRHGPRGCFLRQLVTGKLSRGQLELTVEGYDSFLAGSA